MVRMRLSTSPYGGRLVRAHISQWLCDTSLSCEWSLVRTHQHCVVTPRRSLMALREYHSSAKASSLLSAVMYLGTISRNSGHMTGPRRVHRH
jgi:hypothetical protein